MNVTVYYNVCAITIYMQLLLAKQIAYYSGAKYEWQNRYNDQCDFVFHIIQIGFKEIIVIQTVFDFESIVPFF